MAFADPQSITIGTDPGAVSLPRISTGANTSSYQSSDGKIVLIPSHQYGKRTRRMIRLNRDKLVPSEFTDASNVPVSASIYTVFDVPAFGFTPEELAELYVGLSGQLTASSNALLEQFLGGEN